MNKISMQEAFLMLLKFIAEGKEFPDAEHEVAFAMHKSGWNYDHASSRLRRLYDSQDS